MTPAATPPPPPPLLPLPLQGLDPPEAIAVAGTARKPSSVWTTNEYGAGADFQKPRAAIQSESMATSSARRTVLPLSGSTRNVQLSPLASNSSPFAKPPNAPRSGSPDALATSNVSPSAGADVGPISSSHCA